MVDTTIDKVFDQLHAQRAPTAHVKEEQRKEEDFSIDEEGFDVQFSSETLDLSSGAMLWQLPTTLVNNLRTMGVRQFFPVQVATIPLLLRFHQNRAILPRDLCVSAPTGSGKTLSYAIPIIHTLYRQSCTVTRLRAMVILPSRELANQVHSVFCRLCQTCSSSSSSSGERRLRVELLTGQSDFAKEQELLTGKPAEKVPPSFQFRNLCSNRDLFPPSALPEGAGKVDIVVCTPGRLLEHLTSTPGLCLRHLKFLVLDEADRLLGNAYNGWVRSLVRQAGATEPNQKPSSTSEERNLLAGFCVNRPQRLLFSATLTDNPRKLEMLGIRNPILVKAAEASAACDRDYDNDLTDVATIGEPLKDVDAAEEGVPVVVVSEESRSSFALPKTLQEHFLVVDTATRPLKLIQLLRVAFHSPECSIHVRTGGMCLVFANSLEAAHRLCVLLKLVNGQFGDLSAGISWEMLQENEAKIEAAFVERKSSLSLSKRRKSESSIQPQPPELLFGGLVGEMSGNVNKQSKEAVLQMVHSGAVRVLVCTDQFSRGMDLPQCQLVVNYDTPQDLKVYVHRMGRTARAGQSGVGVSLVRVGQQKAFLRMRGCEIPKLKKGPLEIDPDDLESRYRAALEYFSSLVEQ